jgi:Domain of unknown function (DUF397)
MAVLFWMSSSFSFANGNCVEVARDGDTVHLRDSKHPEDGTLAFTVDEWAAFLAGVHAGEFDDTARP